MVESLVSKLWFLSEEELRATDEFKQKVWPSILKIYGGVVPPGLATTYTDRIRLRRQQTDRTISFKFSIPGVETETSALGIAEAFERNDEAGLAFASYFLSGNYSRLTPEDRQRALQDPTLLVAKTIETLETLFP